VDVIFFSLHLFVHRGALPHIPGDACGRETPAFKTLHRQSQILTGIGTFHDAPMVFESDKMGADKSLARPGRKQDTATEEFEFHISYLLS